MKLLSLLSRHAWTLVGVMLMAVVPLWLIHEGRKYEKERLAKDLHWVEWYPGVLELNRKRGKIVWLQSDHEWGLVCKVNMMRLLSSDDVVKELRRLDVVMVKMDCTDMDPQIVAEMERLGTRTVPFAYIAPANLGGPLIKMPELMMPRDFCDALRESATH